MRARKGFTLFIPNEDINDINKIMKSLEYSGVLIDGDTETVKNEMKKHELCMRHRSDVSFRSYIGRYVADHAETSS